MPQAATALRPQLEAACRWHDFQTAANVTSWEFQLRSDDVSPAAAPSCAPPSPALQLSATGHQLPRMPLDGASQVSGSACA